MNAELQTELEAKTQWTRADVERLAQTRPFNWHFADGVVFNAAALSALDGARRLSFLAFRGSRLSRENLLAVSRLPKLVRLDLHGCTFDADDFADLCDALAADTAAPKFSELWLEDTAIDDNDLREIGKIPGLRWLILSGTKVTDAGLAHLHGLQKLETLWLDRTGVTDDGVLGLAGLPKMSIVVARETACASDIKERLFAAQTELKKSKKPLNQEQVRAADARLRAFLQAMYDWETAAYNRAQESEKQFRAQRPQSNVLSADESAADKVFWREIGKQKAQIANEFCTEKLLARGAARAGSYGNPPAFAVPEGDWIATETPSKTKTVFTGEGRDPDGKRRYTLKWEKETWRLDDVQWWSGGWKRDYV